MQTFFLCNHIDAFSKAVTVYTEQEYDNLLPKYAALAKKESMRTGKSVFYGLVQLYRNRFDHADFFIVPIEESDKVQIENYYGSDQKQRHHIYHRWGNA